MGNKLLNIIQFFIFCSLNYFLIILASSYSLLFIILIIFFDILVLTILFMSKMGKIENRLSKKGKELNSSKKEVFVINFLIDNLINIERFKGIKFIYKDPTFISLYGYKNELFSFLYIVIKNLIKLYNQNLTKDRILYITLKSKEQYIKIDIKSLAEKFNKNDFLKSLNYKKIKNQHNIDITISKIAIDHQNMKQKGALCSILIPKYNSK